VILFVFFLSVIGVATLSNHNVRGGLLWTLVEYLWWRREVMAYGEYVFVCLSLLTVFNWFLLPVSKFPLWMVGRKK
jgi:hypothetical protein